MNVRELLEQLSGAPPCATVLLLPAHRGATGAEILRAVILPRLPWMHERQHRRHGAVDDFFHSGVGPSGNFDDTTDNAILERVVLLIADRHNFDLYEEPAPKGLLSMARVREKAAQHRRQMLANKELIPEEDFRARLGVSRKRLANMLEEGSVFALDVDGESAYPAFLCNKALDLARLRAVARILVPAPPTSRLGFLTRECGALGARVPLDLLVDDRDYRSLRRFAKGWASEFGRTVVKCYDAGQPAGTPQIEPLYTCVTEIDPRRLLWKRALDAIRSPGYRFPHEIPQAPSTLLVRVERATAGESGEALEARLVCELSGRTLRVSVTTADRDEPAIVHKLKLATKGPSVTDLCDAVFSMLKKLAWVQTT